jgi:anti-anti-sigma factor
MDELSATPDGRLNFELSRDDGGSPVVMLQGELDIASADDLEAALQPLIGDGAGRIVVDATGLQFADSSGIALLLRLANAVHSVEIRQPPRLLRDVITRMGLAERLRMVP